jgi:hypothetical protein
MMNKAQASSRSPKEHAQNMVEFALMLPVLLLIVFGVLDLGRLFHGAITIAGAARAGARYATLHPDALDGIDEVVIAEAANSGIDLGSGASEIAWRCPPMDVCDSGLPLRVEVTHTLTLLLPSFFSVPDVPVYSFAEFMMP